MKIKQEVLSVLISSNIEGDHLFLPEKQLDRNLYLEVNKCLVSIGGVWNRKLKCHVFDHDPSDDLDEMINTGEWTDKKKDLQQFYTPADLAKRLVELAEIKAFDLLLEPSAGIGNILDQFPKENEYFAVELDPKNCEILRKNGYSVDKGDFLESNYLVDKIIMNPPFSRQQDIDHVLHAWKCLRPGGILVSIVSESPFFRSNKKAVEFRSFLRTAKVFSLDPGVFKDTMVKTRIIVMRKESNG